MTRVYLDWNATAPPLPAALDAMQAAARAAWANPASIHAHGRAARACVEDARAAVAELAQADPRDVVLTSGGTEANNLALRSAAAAGGVLVTSRLEHPSITRVAEALAAEGRVRLRWLAVRPDGTVDLDDLARALQTEDVRIVALQAANHETGVLQPAAQAIALARAAPRRVHVHVDAVQALGRTCGGATPALAEADTRSLAAHKIRGPKGIGALIARPGAALTPVLLGGSQERGVRPGTVDPIAAAGLAAAARHARGGPQRYAALAPLRDALEEALIALRPGARVIGGAPRAPHVSCIAVPGWKGAELVAALDLEGVSCASGSACSAGTAELSPVVTAMFGEAVAAATVRLSIGEDTSPEDVAAARAAFARTLPRG